MMEERTANCDGRLTERIVQIECPPPVEEREIRYRCYKEIQRLAHREELH